MLVVIVIIILVLSFGFNTYQSQRKYVRYNEGISKILTLIKTAKNYAVISRSVLDESKNPGEESYVPKEGYGIYIEKGEGQNASKVILFANTQIENEEEKNQYDAGDILEEEYILDPQVNLVGLWKDLELPEHTALSDTEKNKAVIIFRPPLADTLIAVNNHPLKDELKKLDDLYLEFRQRDTPEGIPSLYIHINQISGIAEMSQ